MAKKAKIERDDYGNVVRKHGFNQVCVIQGLLVGDDHAEEFERFILEKFGTRVQYLEEIETSPGDGGEGGRIDVFFAVHDDDVMKFAVPRFAIGARWVEDVFSRANYRDPILPERAKKYRLHDEW